MADIEHFSGTVIKKLEDGTEVLSSYVDAGNGETLASDAAQSEKVEAASGNEEETKQALQDASKTQPDEAKPAPLKNSDDVKKAQNTTQVVDKPRSEGGGENK